MSASQVPIVQFCPLPQDIDINGTYRYTFRLPGDDGIPSCSVDITIYSNLKAPPVAVSRRRLVWNLVLKTLIVGHGICFMMVL